MGVMAGLTVGLAALSSLSSIGQGIQAKQEGENLATQYGYQAKQELMASSGKIISDDYRAIQTMNRIAADTGASGFTPGGSAKYVMANTLENQRINDMYTRYSGKLAASQDLYAGKMAQYEGTQQMWGRFIQAGTTAISGGMKTYRGLTTGSWDTGLSV